MTGKPRRLALAQVMDERRLREFQPVVLAVEDGIEQQVRQQRLVAKAVREIMRVRRLGELLAEFDLDLIAVERGVEDGRNVEAVIVRRRDEGFERNVGLLAEAEGVEEAARVEQRRGVEPRPAARLQIMRQRVDRGVAAEPALAIEGDVEQRMRIGGRAGAHEIEQGIAAFELAQALVIVRRKQRARARPVAPAGQNIMQQRIGDGLLRRGDPVQIMEGIE